ncbi:MAG: cation:proton antiporter [Gemmiger sp.]
MILRWIAALLCALLAGKLAAKFRLPEILGWLIAGMLLGPHAGGVLTQRVLDAGWYNGAVLWMQCAVGLMLGSELVWSRIHRSGKGLIVTTLTQSLGAFAAVSAVFGAVFAFTGLPAWLGLVFGGIAMATAPAPALSIVNEFHAKGPVAETLLPVAVLDDIVGVAVFFTVNAVVSRMMSGGAVSLVMIPVMILLPLALGAAVGVPAGLLLKKVRGKAATLAVLLGGITCTVAAGTLANRLLAGVSLNYMLMGVAFSAAFANLVDADRLKQITDVFHPVLAFSLLASIVDLGAPLDFHLILGAGLYTFLYIAARAFGKYFGAWAGATASGMPATVRKYLGLTLLPHSGVSLVFTGVICNTLAPAPELAAVVQGTIAAAAVINEIIAVVAAKKGFELADEIGESAPEHRPARRRPVPRRLSRVRH